MKTNIKLLAGIAVAILVFITASCNTKSSNAQANSQKLNMKNQAPEIDLHMAVITSNMEAIRQHIEAGSDLNIQDPFGGSSPIITAALFGNEEAVNLLAVAGADINYRNKEGSTALITAAFMCHPEVVQLLLEKGADKSIKNNFGSTAYQSVAGDYKDVEPVYKLMSKQLAPMGLVMDFERIEKTRPEVAALLQ